MADPSLPPDFSEFLRLLNAHGVDYLIVGGYAVGFHGHPRATADIDIWVPTREDAARQLVAVLLAFGFDVPQLSEEVFLKPDQVIRLGVPPLRIEILTTIDGVRFGDCLARALPATLGGVNVRTSVSKISRRTSGLRAVIRTSPTSNIYRSPRPILRRLPRQLRRSSPLPLRSVCANSAAPSISTSDRAICAATRKR
jgi:hypothetical protein